MSESLHKLTKIMMIADVEERVSEFIQWEKDYVRYVTANYFSNVEALQQCGSDMYDHIRYILLRMIADKGKDYVGMNEMQGFDKKNRIFTACLCVLLEGKKKENG